MLVLKHGIFQDRRIFHTNLPTLAARPKAHGRTQVPIAFGGSMVTLQRIVATVLVVTALSPSLAAQLNDMARAIQQATEVTASVGKQVSQAIDETKKKAA